MGLLAGEDELLDDGDVESPGLKRFRGTTPASLAIPAGGRAAVVIRKAQEGADFDDSWADEPYAGRGHGKDKQEARQGRERGGATWGAWRQGLSEGTGTPAPGQRVPHDARGHRPSQVDVATTLANGELRQARFHITFGSTNVDKAKNVYFDV